MTEKHSLLWGDPDVGTKDVGPLSWSFGGPEPQSPWDNQLFARAYPVICAFWPLYWCKGRGRRRGVRAEAQGEGQKGRGQDRGAGSLKWRLGIFRICPSYWVKRKFHAAALCGLLIPRLWRWARGSRHGCSIPGCPCMPSLSRIQI